MEQLFEMLKNGKTQFHVVDHCKKILSKAGFENLDYNSNFEIKKGGKYFISPFSSMLVAFVIGENAESLRISAAHTDFPMLKLKPNPEITKKGYIQVNVEPYGGLITQTWFDRPLGLAGKVVCRGESAFTPKVILYDSKRPLFIIPNLAPHLKRDSKVQDVDVQKELIPIGTCLSSLYGESESTNKEAKKNYIRDLIAKDLDINGEDIVDYDLYLYIHANPEYVGINNEFIAGARIDNISSVSAITEVLCQDNIKNCVAVGAFFDNEEIGSRSKQGADSLVLKDIIDRISDKLGDVNGSKINMSKNSFNMSVDVAHATHPNYVEKGDITNDIILGNGVVLKTSASQKYVTDSEAGAVVTVLCQDNDIKMQRQVNRSGMAGGQTLGPIMSAYLSIKSVDIGVPMLAMHSACELVHKDDYTELVKLLSAYYSI